MTEKTTIHQPSKQNISPILIILVCSFTVTFIVINLITVLDSLGILIAWRTLSPPPSRATSIIGTGTSGNLWVKSQEGLTYSILVDPSNCRGKHKNPDCFIWKHGNISPANETSIRSMALKNNDCEALQPDIFPRNPRGELKECVYVEHFGYYWLSDQGYFALTTSGEVLSWVDSIHSIRSFSYSIILSVVLAIAISGLYAFLLTGISVVMRITESILLPSPSRLFTSSRQYFFFAHYILPFIAALIVIYLLYLISVFLSDLPRASQFWQVA